MPLARSARFANDGHALQFDRDRRGQGTDAEGGAAWLDIAEVFGVDAIVGGEITPHVGQENGDVDEILPACAAGFEHGPNIGEDLMTLRLRHARCRSWILLASVDDNRLPVADHIGAVTREDFVLAGAQPEFGNRIRVGAVAKDVTVAGDTSFELDDVAVCRNGLVGLAVVACFDQAGVVEIAHATADLE